ncbi:sigma-70 family RNA polymerase sigma factor [Arthrobacter russicus]|jgi:RNA polymerase sigma factor (sigma-70 family)|uniref:RNA polymerase sigma-70 factor (ECF subfamily) n=1 Tax=Arthrobacter russicus TaxID=172040 RepID=A0ABU1JF12_9MICC|nr:sigma-70 family RNA polymerase sigma factor [Arthrobacter russicus]MDR6271043.1 RNA polymerase sigma-70 factor (ECF subfamily) [Arthrobacter russicus]
MVRNDLLTEQFEAQRPRLRAVAYRMLGSFSEADDAVQEAWLRLSRQDATTIENLAGWLSTVVGRICLDFLRSRGAQREGPLEAAEERIRLPELMLRRADAADPEEQAILADSVGVALLVVLETLSPAERLAFVLHDVFALPFEEIAEAVGKSPEATRQLASRARRKVQGVATVPDPDLAKQRAVVAAFHAASLTGDFDAMVAVLDPEVELRVDQGAFNANTQRIQGAANVASQALMFSQFARFEVPVLVNGVAGLATVVDGRLFSVLAFTVSGGTVKGIDILADLERLGRIDISQLTG